MAAKPSTNADGIKASSPQSEIVLTLLQGEEGSEWAKDRIGWTPSSSESVCSWEGIECDPIDDTVTRIKLGDQDLKGTLPSELGLIHSLLHLDLNKNNVWGTIPVAVAKLPNLEVFNVAGNDFEGTLPVFSSQNLRILDVSHNRMHGTFPEKIGKRLSSLIKLDVSHNGFTGTIPNSITKLKYLDYWDMSGNVFEGSIPHDIGNLKELQGLFLDDNELIGTVPPSLTRPNLKLIQIFLEHNHLSGTIPASLADIPHLTDLFVDGNKFTGTVPRDLCKLNLNEEFFTGAYNVTGRDGCTSIACPVNHASKEGVHPCFECGNQGYSPYIGLNGRCYQKNQKMVLDALYDRTNGPEWNGGSGWGLANVPVCEYEGVICNNAGNIVSISLVGMNLQGTIPAELGFLGHLQVLNVADNELTGYLPSDLRFAPLEELDVSGNRLVGFVPPMVCLTGDINGNGVNGDFNCDVVACSPGTWSSIGRSTPAGSYEEGTKSKYKCMPCSGGAKFLGSKTCSSPAASGVATYVEGHPWAAILGACLTVAFVSGIGSLMYIRRNRNSVYAREGDMESRSVVSDYYDEEYDPDDVSGRYSDESPDASYRRHVASDDNAQQTIRASNQSRKLPDETLPVAGGTTDAEEEKQRRSGDEWKPDGNDEPEDLWLDVPKIT